MIRKYALYLIVGVAFLWVSDAIIKILPPLIESIHVASTTVPYQTETRESNMLVVGDSTAYGIGAYRPSESTAGYVAQALSLGVENRSRSGALTREVYWQIEKARETQYDLILIQVGANDVMKFKSLKDAGDELDQALFEARKRSERVVLLTAGDIGTAPIWPMLLGDIYTVRTKELREIFIATAARHDVAYVDLLSLPDPFTTDIDKYFAPDTLHPSGEGYAVWAGYILNTIQERWPELYARR